MPLTSLPTDLSITGGLGANTQLAKFLSKLPLVKYAPSVAVEQAALGGIYGGLTSAEDKRFEGARDGAIGSALGYGVGKLINNAKFSASEKKLQKIKNKIAPEFTEKGEDLKKFLMNDALTNTTLDKDVLERELYEVLEQSLMKNKNFGKDNIEELRQIFKEHIDDFLSKFLSKNEKISLADIDGLTNDGVFVVREEKVNGGEVVQKATNKREEAIIHDFRRYIANKIIKELPENFNKRRYANIKNQDVNRAINSNLSKNNPLTNDVTNEDLLQMLGKKSATPLLRALGIALKK